MKMKALIAFAVGTLLYVSALAADKPTVVILATGGTIAGAGTSASSNAYTAGEVTINTLIASVHGVDKLANLKFDQVANIPSQDMNDEVWLKLAASAQKYLDDDSVNGIVITHGTDTMEETAFFLNLVLKTNKPVIVTGSMRPSTAISADGPINLYNSVAVAGSEQAKGLGVLIVMNDRIYDARDCTKTNTSTCDTFASPNTGSIGFVDFGNIRIYKSPLRKHTMDSEFNIKDITALPKVDIVYEYENGDNDLMKAAASNPDVKGIVVAGVGDGNLFRTDFTPLKDARTKNGVAIVMSSKVGSGCVWKNSEMENDKLQFNTADTLNPAKARVLLRVILTKTNDYNKIEEVFNTY
ncbi:MAG: type II asparaginase [Lentisphaerota bacterium]